MGFLRKRFGGAVEDPAPILRVQTACAVPFTLIVSLDDPAIPTFLEEESAFGIGGGFLIINQRLGSRTISANETVYAALEISGLIFGIRKLIPALGTSDVVNYRSHS